MEIQIWLVPITLLLFGSIILQISADYDIERRSEGDVILYVDVTTCESFKNAIVGINGSCTCPQSHSTFHYVNSTYDCYSQIELGGSMDQQTNMSFMIFPDDYYHELNIPAYCPKGSHVTIEVCVWSQNNTWVLAKSKGKFDDPISKGEGSGNGRFPPPDIGSSRPAGGSSAGKLFRIIITCGNGDEEVYMMVKQAGFAIYEEDNAPTTPKTAQAKNDSSTLLKILVGFTGGILFALLAGVYILYRRWQNDKNKQTPKEPLKEITVISNSDVTKEDLKKQDSEPYYSYIHESSAPRPDLNRPISIDTTYSGINVDDISVESTLYHLLDHQTNQSNPLKEKQKEDVKHDYENDAICRSISQYDEPVHHDNKLKAENAPVARQENEYQTDFGTSTSKENTSDVNIAPISSITPEDTVLSNTECPPYYYELEQQEPILV